ncbi:hypothetical protein LEP1GSC013_4195 [Leptospira interrogans serovar Valbuzzi str. Duyster]|nr:hypothetical protein LEP1GSC013_4195 [Leptospira interrogans serovar Valbuzzi str. Duyster]ENO70783.1 hypothetical protein LEP1GSC012_1309 [Leptospira interrogans serovar Valbuzzi str. Valbuzzi]
MNTINQENLWEFPFHFCEKNPMCRLSSYKEPQFKEKEFSGSF